MDDSGHVSEEEMDSVDTGSESEAEEMDADGESGEASGEAKVFLPGDSVAENEELVCDESAYIMYHQAQTGIAMSLGPFPFQPTVGLSGDMSLQQGSINLEGVGLLHSV